MTLVACSNDDGGGSGASGDCAAETVVSEESDPCITTLATYEGTSDLVISAAWSPRDDYVLSGSNGDVRLLRIADDPPSIDAVTSYSDQGGRAFVAWSPDGEYALTSSTDVRLLHVDRAGGTLAEIAPPFAGHQGDIYALAWSPDGTHALSVGEDGFVRLLAVDVAGGSLTEIADFEVFGYQVYDVAFSPTGTLAAVAVQDGTLRVLGVAIEPPSLTEVARSSMDSWVTAVAWSPTSDEILAGSWLPCGTVELEALEGGHLKNRGVLEHHASGIRVAHFTPDGNVAITAGHDDTVRLSSLPSFPVHVETTVTWRDNLVGVHSVSLGNDRRRMLVAASHADRLTLLDLSSCPLP